MNLKNVYFIYGDENLIIQNKINYIINEVRTTEHNITVYDIEESNLSTIIEDASMAPFLADYKVVVIKNPIFLSSSDHDSNLYTNQLIKYLNNPLETTIMIINGHGVKIDKRKEVTKVLLKKAEVSETKALTEVEMRGWLIRQLSLENITIREDAIKSFFNIAGKDLVNAQNEVAKLINYIGPGGEITNRVVHDVVVKELEKDVFSLTNAIIAQEKQKVIKNYQRLMKDGNNPNYIFSLISKTIRDLLVVQAMLSEGYDQNRIASAMGYSSGRAYYAVKNAKSLNKEVVESYVSKIGDLDYKIKSGQIDFRTGLDFLILGL